MSQKTKAIYIGICALFCFVGLSTSDLSAPDEPRYALVAQEMLEDGHWLLLHRNGRPYPDKPPFFFWSIALVSKALGGEVSAFSARFPSALSALLIALLLMKWESKTTDKIPLSPILFLSAWRIFFQAHLAQIDMMLTLTTTLSTYLGWQLMTKDKTQSRWFGLVLGVGIITKGPVAFILPLGALCIYFFIYRKTQPLKFPKFALLWMLVVPVLWLSFLMIDVSRAGEWDTLKNTMFNQTVTRYLNPWHHFKPWYYFGPTFLSDFFPWSLLFIACLPFRKEKLKSLNRLEKMCLIFIGFTIVFFSISKAKRNVYIMPVYPLASLYISLVWQRMKTWKWAAWPIGAMTLLFAGGLLGVAMGWIPIKDFKSIDDLPRLTLLTLGMLGFISTLISTYLILKGRKTAWLLTNTAFSMVLCCFVFLSIMPWLSPFRSPKVFMEELNRDLGESQTLAMVDFREAYSLFSGRKVKELAPHHEDQSNPKLIGLPQLPAFWELDPEAMILIRREHLNQYVKNSNLPPYSIVREVHLGDRTHMIVIKRK